MKRRLALLMVLVLLVGLVPMNVFATTNKVTTVPTVTEDWDFLADGSATTIRIEETDADDFNTSQTFTLELKNAEWSTETSSLFTNTSYGYAESTGSMIVTATYIDSRNLEIQVYDGGSTDEDWFKIPLLAEVQDAGVAEVMIVGESTVTEGTYTFAKVASGDTKVTYSADDVKAFSDTQTLGTIKLEELAIGTITSGSQVKLKLTNSDFKWAEQGASSPTLSYGNGFNGHATFTYNTTADDDQTLVYDVKVAGATGRGYITITNAKVEADSDAAYGDVKVKVYGDDVTTETITVAKYSDYSVTVKCDEETKDINTVDAGYLNSTATYDREDNKITTMTGVVEDDEDNELSMLWIKEDVAGTMDEGKKVKVAFPEWVHIMSVDVTSDSDNVANAAAIEALANAGDLGNELEFVVDKTTATDKYELALTFYVTVEADAKGDIEASVSGKAMNGETMKAVIGKAVAPVTLAVETKDVKIGLNDQAVGKVTITEAADGQLAKGKWLDLEIDDMSVTGTITAKVTKGDIKIGDIEKQDGVLYIEIDNESSEASTIEISGIEVDVNRSVAEGSYDINLGGTAVVKNNDNDELDDDYFFDNDTVASAAYVRVITPAPGDTKAGEKVVFTIGAADYMVGAVKMTSDAAPFIDANNRTMLPLRALANALGVADANIMWNEVERSVTIFKGDATIKVVIGQNSFVKNGVSIPMDTQAVIVNGRTFLPVRAIGQALGATVTWDEATKTVTVQ